MRTIGATQIDVSLLRKRLKSKQSGFLHSHVSGKQNSDKSTYGAELIFFLRKKGRVIQNHALSLVRYH